MTVIEEVKFEDGVGDTVEVTLRGEVEAVIKALCVGLGMDALTQLRDAMTDELARRRSKGGES